MNSCAEWMTNFSCQVKMAVSSTTSRIPPLPFWRGTLTPTSLLAHLPPFTPNEFSMTVCCQGSNSKPDEVRHLEHVVGQRLPSGGEELNPRRSALNDYHLTTSR